MNNPDMPVTEWMKLSDADRDSVLGASLDLLSGKRYFSARICQCKHKRARHHQREGYCHEENCICQHFDPALMKSEVRKEIPTPNEFRAIDEAVSGSGQHRV